MYDEKLLWPKQKIN